jgi:hypothetical protein
MRAGVRARVTSSGPNDAPADTTIDVGPLAARVFVGCVLVELALVALDYHVNYGRLAEIGAIRRLFNTAREDGLASFFGVTQTAFVALTAWLVARTTRLRGDGRRRTAGWLVLTGFFAYMAIDDGSKLHERVGTAVEHLSVRGGLPSAFPSYAWQVVFLPFFAALGLFTLVFLWRELRDWTGRSCVLVGLGLFVVAVGMDFCEGLDPKHPWNPYAWIARRPGIEALAQARFQRPAFDTALHFSKSIEEFFEMLGTTFLWTAMLRHWSILVRGMRIRIRD